MSPFPWMMNHQTLRRGNHDCNREMKSCGWPWTSLWYNFHRISEAHWGRVSSWFLLRIQLQQDPQQVSGGTLFGTSVEVARVKIRPVHPALPKSANVLECDENFSAGGQSRLQERASLSFSLSISFRKTIFFPPANESLQPKWHSLERKN